MSTYDAWGDSWGDAWGDAWVHSSTVDPHAFQCGVFDPVAFDTNCSTSTTETFSGGYPSYESSSERNARVRRERERLGIIAPEPAAQEVIQRVAERQAGDASLDEIQRTEELVRELEAAGLEMQRGYLQLLEVERTQARTEELRRYLLAIQRQRDDDDAIRALLMIALMQ